MPFVTRLAVILMLTPALAVAADPLAGNWQLTGISEDGRPDAKIPELKLTFNEGKIRPYGGKAIEAETYTIDTAARPHTIDFTLGGKKKAGIFEVKGDVLRICFPDLRGETRRPKSFDEKEFRVTLWELARIKDGEPSPPAEPPANDPAATQTAEWSVAKDAPLTLIDEADGTFEIVEDKGGSIIRATNYYLYFAIDDEFAADLPEKTADRVSVRMKVRHASGVQFDLQYDAHPPSGAKLDHDGRWTGTAKHDAGAQWRELVVPLPRARLSNRQNGGADFRFRAEKGLEVRDVAVVRETAKVER
jgi:uncharacterized protein (TIGR03067 family)